MSPNQRTIFFLSDGTGITAEALGQSLLSQFESIEFIVQTIPYVDTVEKAEVAAQKIKASCNADGSPAIVFATLVNPEIRQTLQRSEAVVFDLFQAFLAPLEQALGSKSTYTVGRSHSNVLSESYQNRIEAIHYALACDDGLSPHQYNRADVIILGVSRSGKTPTSLYLALQFGILAANYPLTEEDLQSPELPELLRPYRHKLFGLLISAKRLQTIRRERRPNSRYASAAQCEQEVDVVKRLYLKENIPSIDSTEHSIEELSTKILAITGLQRRVY